MVLSKNKPKFAPFTLNFQTKKRTKLRKSQAFDSPRQNSEHFQMAGWLVGSFRDKLLQTQVSSAQGQARVGGGRKMMGKIDFSCGNRSWTVGEGW